MESYQITSFLDLIVRLALDLTAAWMVTMGLFNHYNRKKALVFCLFMFNLLIFIVGYLLSNAKLEMGAGLGLFALFTMMRYRSETLNLREMTYLFIIITIGFINSTSGIDNLFAIGFLDVVILLLAFLLEKYIGSRILSTEKMKYDNLKLLKPQYRQLLLQDIYYKTGIVPKSIEIDSISFSDKSANLTIYYDEKEYLSRMEDENCTLDIHDDDHEPEAKNKIREIKKTDQVESILN